MIINTAFRSDYDTVSLGSIIVSRPWVPGSSSKVGDRIQEVQLVGGIRENSWKYCLPSFVQSCVRRGIDSKVNMNHKLLIEKFNS